MGKGLCRRQYLACGLPNKNVGEALLQVFQTHHQAIELALATDGRAAFCAESVDGAGTLAAEAQHGHAACSAPALPTVPPIPQQVQAAQDRAAAKAARHAQVRALHHQGWSLRAIATATGLDRRTVRTYTRMSILPAATRGSRPSLLDPYKPYLLERWNAGCRNAMQLLQEIRHQGYPGQRSIVRSYLTALRKAQGLAPRSRSILPGAITIPPRCKIPTLRTLVWAVLKPESKRTAEEAARLARLRGSDPAVARAVKVAQEFTVLVRERKPEQFDGWLEDAQQSGLKAFASLVKSLRQDEAAVRAALSLPWSNGSVEGHINRLKVLKRQAYGRAKLDLLRIRLLAA